MQVVKIAMEIIAMQRELEHLRDENVELRPYKKLYQEEIRAGMKHGEKMMANLLDVVLTPGVIDACRKNAKQPASRSETEE